MAVRRIRSTRLAMGARCEHPVFRPGPGSVITVVGLARSGAAAGRFLLEQGCVVRVTEAEDQPALRRTAQELEAVGAAVEIGRHSRPFVLGSQMVVLSPGVPMSAVPVVWARELGIPIVGELELGSWYCTGPRVAVTGSNGKSTVVTLLGEMLREAGRDSIVCGNIGRPLTGELGRIGPKTVAVLEVSSFQLESSLSFHTEVAAVLNITDNHFDRHGSFARYQEAKGRLFAYQGRRAWGLLNADNPGSLGLQNRIRSELVLFSRRRKVQGACIRSGVLTLTLPHRSGPICPAADLPAQGPHHEENALAASCLAGLLGVEPEAMGRVLRRFRGLPHRQERIAQIRGVTFINDSKSTTVASGIRAIEAAPGQVVLIAGGRDKGSDFRQLRPLAKKLKAAVVIGEDGSKIAASLKGTVPIRRAEGLAEAVRAAFEMAAGGGSVLLSPMCTSFDMFQDFEERGERFTEAVRRIAG